MDKLINQIITIQKLQITKQIVNSKKISKVDFINLIKIVAENVNYEFQNKNKKIIINNKTNSEFYLLANETYLISAFENVLRNAASHTKENTCVNINISNSKKHIKLQIIDKGDGIDSKEEEHSADKEINNIFEPFFRVDSSRNRKTGGYGLGLSIAKAVIENHNGKIYAKNNNEETAGLTITIKLPII